MLVDGLRVSEITHNFNANSSRAWEGDVNATTAPTLGWLPNLWECQWLKLVARTEQHVEDLAEVNLMGFQPFSHGAVGNGSPATRAEASERPTYTTVSMLHLSTGNPTFGDVALVMRPSAAQRIALLEPLDTGNWEMYCNATGPRRHQCASFPFAVNCSAWSPPVQGTFEHPEAVLLANIRVWDGGSCVNETGGMLPRLFAMLYGESRADRTLTHPSQMMTFVEANLAGTVLYSDGVKLVVATAQSLFGTALAADVRAWCAERGWALLWTLAPDDDPSWWSGGNAVMDTRVLDPTVSTTLNLSASPAAAAAFNATWGRVAAERARGGGAGIAWTDKVWPSLPSELVVSAGLWPGKCADADACVATSLGDGRCVCYHTPPWETTTRPRGAG